MNTFNPILSTERECKLADLIRKFATTCDKCKGENLPEEILCRECRKTMVFKHREGCY